MTVHRVVVMRLAVPGDAGRSVRRVDTPRDTNGPYRQTRSVGLFRAVPGPPRRAWTGDSKRAAIDAVKGVLRNNFEKASSQDDLSRYSWASELETLLSNSLVEISLRACFTANGAGEQGTVRLLGAHIGGQLDCSGAAIRNHSGPALRAGSLQVDGRFFLGAGFTADGAGELGTVRLIGTRIGVQLDCSGAAIRNPSGPALHGALLDVAGNVFLRAGFTADGTGELGTMRLVGAHISGQLDCSGAVVESRSDPQHRWTLTD